MKKIYILIYNEMQIHSYINICDDFMEIFDDTKANIVVITDLYSNIRYNRIIFKKIHKIYHTNYISNIFNSNNDTMIEYVSGHQSIGVYKYHTYNVKIEWTYVNYINLYNLNIILKFCIMHSYIVSYPKKSNKSYCYSKKLSDIYSIKKLLTDTYYKINNFFI